MANCVALSQHALCNNLQLALDDIQYTSIIDSTYYNFKLESVISSLPQNFLETKIWKEFPDPSWHIEHHPGALDRTLCYVAHNNEQLNATLQKHPSTRIIKLVNYHKFNKLCFGLKSPTSDVRRHIIGYSQWDQNSSLGHFDFNVDTVYSVIDFLTEVQRLYDFLELDDFQPDLVQKFHRAYLDCHGLT